MLSKGGEKMKELSVIDFDILKFVFENEKASIKELRSAFPEIQSIEHRIRTLSLSSSSLPYLAEDIEIVILDNGFKNTNGLGIFRLTDTGRIALQDYESKKRISNRDLWLKNAWIPILVSLVTNLAITGTKWLILLIQELLHRTP